mmetsp:Transcript_45994/g.100188  ORF Transcript_45994/g.100188 Transcript_45994/m.100188 type:complete len:271 (+) Transcript_45994:407-1219(+)
MLLHREAAAIDAHLLRHDGVHVQHHAVQGHLTALVLVEHQQGLIPLMRLQLTVEHRDHVGSITVEQISGQQPPVRLLAKGQGIAQNPKGREETLRHQAHRGGDVADPGGTFLFAYGSFAPDAEVVTATQGVELHLEDLEQTEFLDVAGVGLKLAVAHHGEGRKKHGDLFCVARDEQSINVQREADSLYRLLGRELPQLAFPDGLASKRLVHLCAVRQHPHDLRHLIRHVQRTDGADAHRDRVEATVLLVLPGIAAETATHAGHSARSGHD